MSISMDSTHRDRGGESLINTVEPMYAFDVHCNGFFPLIVFSYFGNSLMVLLGVVQIDSSLKD